MSSDSNSEQNLATAALEAQNIPIDPAIKEMVDAGVFYGRMKTRTNPKMRPYILTNRNGIEVINLAKTKECLDAALEFVKERVAKNMQILLLGTQPPAHEGIAKLANEFKLPSVTLRWLGGTITNYKIISKRIEYLKKLKTDWAAGAFQKYTKKERVGIERELNRLNELIGTLESLTARPELLIIIDPVIHMTAIREAQHLHIPVVAFTNTDANPDTVDYLIPGNTKTRTSINWFVEKVADALKEGKAAAAKIQAASPAPEPEKKS